MGARTAPPNTSDLPADYRCHSEVDLKADRRAAAGIQVIFVLVVGVMVGLVFVLDLPLDGRWSAGATAAATVVACVVYMAVHELTHAAALRTFSDVAPTVALRFPYLVTGSRAYLNRRAAAVVALAPGAVWGVVLIVLLLTLPQQFFLTVYVVTALNFAGSAGDCVEAHAVARLPQSALIQDDGTATRVFLPAT